MSYRIVPVEEGHEHDFSGVGSSGLEHTNEKYERSEGKSCRGCSAWQTYYWGVDYETGKSLDRVEIRG